ncbi:furin-like protease 2 [Schistocerca cancellata]|uniref:furin-like protease 2 n=1 Tax=Schistocerca cancellata TaxID=274614 RepID=UPI0021182FAF|nr:furin-like protease 2 [Schistocerca cancellata]
MAEKQVTWVQQQRELRRSKRDLDAAATTTRRRAVRGNTSFTDPLYKEQWYLNGGAKGGLDMNVTGAWSMGYTGKGVVVSILDDGIQTNHPDLAPNYDPLASTDINDNDSDPTPRDNGDNKHGTRCAGEVAAVAYNSYCGVGVAYNASIGGVRMLDGTVNDAVEARALGLNPEHVDVYSASWGPEDDGKTVDGPGPLARRAFVRGVTSGRKGKGSIFVWASGNGGRHTDSCNCDGYTNSIFTLSISSATQAGYKPWYLEECSSTLATTYSSGTPGRDKSVATVDMDGRLRPDHLCTVDHTGTSASAPLAAGIVALALQANPNLTWRDVQYLVLITSRPEPLQSEAGWALNGVNRKVSHKFGYGLMDAGAMVALAEKWTNVPTQHICKSQEINEDRELEASAGASLRVHMDVSGCTGSASEVRFLEHVQCRVSLRFLPRGNLRVRLTSPAGTACTLLSPRPRDLLSAALDDWAFLSVHYWGEAPDGRWTLDIVNAGSRRATQPGMLKKWQLIFYGTATKPVNVRSSGDGGPGPPPRAPTPPPGSELGPEGGAGGAGAAAAAGAGLMAEEEGGGNVRVLHTCDAECDAQGCYGKGPTQCIACRHYRLDNSCVSRCPPRSFPSQGGVCWPCHESCETCAGPGQDSCLTCAPAHLRLTDIAVCLQQCPDGYLENMEEGTCEPCSGNCATCVERADRCASCEHHLLLYSGRCHAACPPGTFETDGNTCSPCHATCESCRGGAGAAQCVTCRRGLLFSGGKCREACPAGQRPDARRRECAACPPGCLHCSATACLACAPGWTLHAAACLPRGNTHCDSGEFYDAGGGRCRPCHSTCEACDGATESACVRCASPLLLQGRRCASACDAGWFPEPRAAACLRCPHVCTRCQSPLNCTACAPGLLLQSGQCRPVCAPGYYGDRGVCAKCYLSCATCSGPRRDQCVTCPRGWQLAAGECLPECPEGFFQTPFGCEKCHHYCRTCNGPGPLHCTSCPSRAELDVAAGLCVSCLDAQYYEPLTQRCLRCHATCRTCSGPGAGGCTSCASPLRLQPATGRCVPCCAREPRADCCPCDNRTGECHSWSLAGKRRTKQQQQQQQQGGGELPAPGGTSRGSAYLSGMGEAAPAVLHGHEGGPLVVVAFAICGCIAAVCLFTVIFTVLQERSQSRRVTPSDGYKKLESTPSVRFKTKGRSRASRHPATPAVASSEVELLGASFTLYSGDDTDTDVDDLDDVSTQLFTRT